MAADYPFSQVVKPLSNHPSHLQRFYHPLGHYPGAAMVCCHPCAVVEALGSSRNLTMSHYYKVILASNTVYPLIIMNKKVITKGSWLLAPKTVKLSTISYDLHKSATHFLLFVILRI